MGALLLPVGVKEVLDARRRSFLWNGSDKASGAQCLVAWERVCATKEDGGLGIKRLDTPNACLLLKLIHRLHHPAESSWASWALQNIRLSHLKGEVDGPHWEALRDLLPAYRNISRVEVGNGATTSFWQDHWITDSPLSAMFPALFSHFTGRQDSVQEVVTAGLTNLLQARLTPRAADEFQELSAILHSTALTDSPDESVCGMEGSDHKLATGLIYRALVQGDQKSPFFSFVWNNFAPPRVSHGCWCKTGYSASPTS